MKELRIFKLDKIQSIVLISSKEPKQLGNMKGLYFSEFGPKDKCSPCGSNGVFGLSCKN